MSAPQDAHARQPLEGRINYANCWEDPQTLLAGLDVGADDDVLSVCSAGDNAFALAIAGARSVTAVDFSAPQLHLAELKLRAAQILPVDAFRNLLGLDAFGRRVFLYHQVRDALSEDARAFWNANEHLIRQGLLDQGRFEQYLIAFRTRVLPLVQWPGTVSTMAGLEDLDAQRALYHRKWNSRRWRALFRVFFSQRVMAPSGRSPEQFRYVDGPVGAEFLRRAEHVLTELPVATNPFLVWILTGAFPDLEAAHPYLSTAGHAALRDAADRITLVHGDLFEVLAGAAPGTWSAFNYSDVPEYLSEADHARFLGLTADAARPGARVLYWNLLVPRHRPDSLAHRIERHPERAADLHFHDRTFVYGGVQLETVTGAPPSPQATP